MNKIKILDQGITTITAEYRPPSGSKEANNENKLNEIGWSKSNDKYRMDSDKLLWHSDRVKEWMQGKRVVPLHIDMGITTGCNLGCVFCYGVVQGRNGFLGKKGMMEMMPLETIIGVFNDAKKFAY